MRGDRIRVASRKSRAAPADEADPDETPLEAPGRPHSPLSQSPRTDREGWL